jgi:AcrR family transcriptional regulator
VKTTPGSPDHVLPRGGRRPGSTATRDGILNAARESFGSRGFAGTTIRGVARAAGVDPALVHHFFTSKDRLFEAALEFPIRPVDVLPDVLGETVDGLGERIVRLYLSTWENPETGVPLAAIYRCAMTNDVAADLLRNFLGSTVVEPIARRLGGTNASLVMTLVGSQLFGLGVARYILHMDTISNASVDTIVRNISPGIQSLIDSAHVDAGSTSVRPTSSPPTT